MPARPAAPTGLPERARIGYESAEARRRVAENKGSEMAEDQMLRDHERTWGGFVKLIVYSTAAVVVTLALMAIFLL